MKRTVLPFPLFGSLALALATAGWSGVSAASEEAASTSVDQAHIARATLALESQFSDQFKAGQIDRAALQPAIDDVVQAVPVAVRPTVREHIAAVLDHVGKLAPTLTPEQRVDILAWGYPGLGATYNPVFNPPGFNPWTGNMPGYNPPGFGGWW